MASTPTPTETATTESGNGTSGTSHDHRHWNCFSLHMKTAFRFRQFLDMDTGPGTVPLQCSGNRKQNLEHRPDVKEFLWSGPTHRHGQGVYHYHDTGSKYRGSWVNGNMELSGEFLHRDHRFQGNFNNNRVSSPPGQVQTGLRPSLLTILFISSPVVLESLYSLMSTVSSTVTVSKRRR